MYFLIFKLLFHTLTHRSPHNFTTIADATIDATLDATLMSQGFYFSLAKSSDVHANRVVNYLEFL